jgi:hypothetical protein
VTRRTILGGTLFAGVAARGFAAPQRNETLEGRRQAALELKQRAALLHSKQPLAAVISNGDEAGFPHAVGCFTKGLPQNRFGEVLPSAYQSLLAAIKSGKHTSFERIPRGGGRKLNNPQSAFAYQTEGADSHQFSIPPAPSLASKQIAAEMSELYWQAVCRDVPFSSYEVSPFIREAAKQLDITPATVFRSPTNVDLKGPYISQFLLKPIPLGTTRIEQRYRVPVAGNDFMTSFSEWTQIQAGFPPWREATYDTTHRYIRNGRDLAEYVHYDFAFQAYLHAALILLNSGPVSILNCNPFKSANSPYLVSTVQEGFVTFGHAEVTDFLGRVTTAALKAAYYQKWAVHRRLRPEAMGGLVHQNKIGARKYAVHEALLDSSALKTTLSRTGTYLLPQAYPEGCPLHPSYPAGHAVVGGACSIVLKACFNESMLLPGCVEPDADGLSLAPCSGYWPTVEQEVNKLAYNIAMGRNWAGIHYRSDDAAGLRLGEDVAISILQDLVQTYTEDFGGFSFTRLDGTKVRITPGGEVTAA